MLRKVSFYALRQIAKIVLNLYFLQTKDQRFKRIRNASQVFAIGFLRTFEFLFCSSRYTKPIFLTPFLIPAGSSGPPRSFPPDGTTFKQIEFSQKISHEIEGYGYLNLQFYQSQNSYVKFEYNIPRGSSIAVYIRRNALPTHTQYHILDILKGFKIRNTRASHNVSYFAVPRCFLRSPFIGGRLDTRSCISQK